MKKIIKEIYSYLIIIILVVLFRIFIATPVRVDGESMVSTLNNNDILILNKLNKNYKRFDVVVIKYNNSKLVKRIIGLPGENIEYKNNDLFINGTKLNDKFNSRTNDFSLKDLYNMSNIPDNYYFVMGDNRNNSLDSRDHRVGLIKKEDIIGTTSIRIFPFTSFGKFK